MCRRRCPSWYSRPACPDAYGEDLSLLYDLLALAWQAATSPA